MARQRSDRPDPDRALAAIHRHCMVCSGMERKVVHTCRVTGCDLYPYREPFRDQVPPSMGEQIDIWEELRRRETDDV